MMDLRRISMLALVTPINFNSLALFSSISAFVRQICQIRYESIQKKYFKFLIDVYVKRILWKYFILSQID